MLIIGFLFLMYDALDDRFSRRVRRPQVVVEHGDHGNNHGHGNEHGQEDNSHSHNSHE
jgi:hypothetical protein